MKTLNQRITNRKYPIALRSAAVGLSLLLSSGVLAQGSTTGASNQNQNSDSDPGELIRYRVTILMIDLSEENEFGTGVSTEQIEGKVTESGVTKTAMDLKKFGNVEILFQAESEAYSKEKSRIFSGVEKPFLTEFHNTNNAGKSVRSTSQSTVTSGVTVELSPQKDSDSIVEIEIDMDYAYTVDKQTSAGTSTLIERVRYSGESVIQLNEEEPVDARRHFMSQSGEEMEFLFITELETQ